MVLDADALNILSKTARYFDLLKANTIITPHPKESIVCLARVKLNWHDLNSPQKKAVKHKIIIVLKGHYTAVFFEDGKISFNASGNAGMAKGGSGDVLTGIITALLSQSYHLKSPARLGVYLQDTPEISQPDYFPKKRC